MNDLISRQAAKDAFTKATGDGDKVEFCWWVLDSVPTIDPVKHGKWTLITNNYIDPQKYMCSVCGRTIRYYGIPGLLLEKYPYCNCGARMDGGKENE